MLVLVLAATLAHAQAPVVRPDVQPLLDQALRHYEAREYAAAAAAIEAVYAADPKPDLLYMWAQSKRLAGDCAAAVPLYQRYLATNPAPAGVERAARNLARCEPLRTPPPPPPRVVLVERPPPPPRPPGPPWHRDRAGLVLAGGGAAALLAAGGFEIAARASLFAAYDATSYPDVARHADAAARREKIALGALVAGSALILGATARYLWVALRR